MRDQADGIRRLLSARKGERIDPGNARTRARVVAVTSGKGGVGKTSVSVNLAIAAASRGTKVVLVDVDLGLANVDILLGVSPRYNLSHVIAGRKALHEIMVRAPGGILVVPGASGIAALADLDSQSRERLVEGFDALEAHADLILIDTGAGIGGNVIRFASAAEEVLVLATSDPASMTDAYATIKTIWQSGRRGTLRLAVNMSRSAQEAVTVASRLQDVVSRFLGGQRLEFIGAIPYDTAVASAVRERTPFVISRPRSLASKAVRLMAGRLLKDRRSNAAAARAAAFVHRGERTRGFLARLGALVNDDRPGRLGRAGAREGSAPLPERSALASRSRADRSRIAPTRTLPPERKNAG